MGRAPDLCGEIRERNVDDTHALNWGSGALPASTPPLVIVMAQVGDTGTFIHIGTVKEIRICHPKIFLFDIKIILS